MIYQRRGRELQQRSDGPVESRDVSQRQRPRRFLVPGDDRLQEADVLTYVARDVGQSVEKQAPDARRVGVEADEDRLEVRVARGSVDLAVDMHVVSQHVPRVV